MKFVCRLQYVLRAAYPTERLFLLVPRIVRANVDVGGPCTVQCSMLLQQLLARPPGIRIEGMVIDGNER